MHAKIKSFTVHMYLTGCTSAVDNDLLYVTLSVAHVFTDEIVEYLVYSVSHKISQTVVFIIFFYICNMHCIRGSERANQCCGCTTI